MTRISAALVIGIVLGMVACNRERAAVTGSFGDGIVGGRVVMADGSSPAGVEVAVTGTGMRMVVGEDGSFAFANVPAHAELLFHRQSLMASLAVSAGERALEVELSANAATPAGRRRGVSRDIAHREDRAARRRDAAGRRDDHDQTTE